MYYNIHKQIQDNPLYLCLILFIFIKPVNIFHNKTKVKLKDFSNVLNMLFFNKLKIFQLKIGPYFKIPNLQYNCLIVYGIVLAMWVHLYL